jgi:hypothetical protein
MEADPIVPVGRFVGSLKNSALLYREVLRTPLPPIRVFPEVTFAWQTPPPAIAPADNCSNADAG